MCRIYRGMGKELVEMTQLQIYERYEPISMANFLLCMVD